MDYKKHYDTLMERAKNRSLATYTERHHVVPRCIGGSDEPDNLVKLTPEEHYVAHQLLVKMHPDVPGLVYAANMMTVEGSGQSRPNKRYGWLKRRHVSECRKRTGKKNGSYGRKWYHDPVTLDSGKFLKQDVPEGWVKGRVPKDFRCVTCGNRISKRNTQRCDLCASRRRSDIGKEISANRPRSYHGRESELVSYLNLGYGLWRSLGLMGYRGANSKSGAGRWGMLVREEYQRTLQVNVG